MHILGIETSCDETSVALLKADTHSLDLLVHETASQATLHAKYGGVVPEVAARKHLEVIIPLLDSAVGRKRLSEIDGIAVTTGPGLITSLMIGVQVAKTLSWIYKKPLIGIQHLEAHIYANWLTHPELVQSPDKYFPSLALVVSGGHTLFVLMRGHGQYQLLGQTVDDAAGEAFDKVAKMLALGYPGGPAIAKLAEHGDPSAIDFPRPMLEAPGYDVSFSGLKTAVRYYLEKKKHVSTAELPDVAASFQQAVVDLLVGKLEKAFIEVQPKSLMLVGGVSANTSLRKAVSNLGSRYDLPFFTPELVFTGDNAAMIAAAGVYRFSKASNDAWKTLTFQAQQVFV